MARIFKILWLNKLHLLKLQVLFILIFMYNIIKLLLSVVQEGSAISISFTLVKYITFKDMKMVLTSFKEWSRTYWDSYWGKVFTFLGYNINKHESIHNIPMLSCLRRLIRKARNLLLGNENIILLERILQFHIEAITFLE